MTEKRFNFNVNKYQIEQDGKYFAHLDVIDAQKITNKLNELNNKNDMFERHIERNTLSKIKVNDVLDCAKYDKFYDNEEAIKSIDWIAKQLGVDLE